MQSAPGVPLKRSLSLLQATLYGLGVTIGAGIYVLIGAAAARAGMHAPIAFVLAAILMALTAASFAELAGRMPVAAGEAAYVRDAFQSDKLALFVGLLVVAVAVVSAAAISVGSAGYISVFVAWPETILIAVVVLAMDAIAGWEARTCRPGAGFGVAPLGQGSPATDHLMVGIQVSVGAGRFGSGPYPGVCWADSALGNNRVDVTRAMAAFSKVDMRTSWIGQQEHQAAGQCSGPAI